MKTLGLYVHIPFCKSKCYYCDFASYVGKDELMEEYIRALIKEANKYKSFSFDTIFIGGGTPSYLSEYLLKQLCFLFNKIIDTSKVVEFTMEVNPGTLSEEKMKIIKDIGVDRISLGLQSANDKTLKKLGRIHSFDDFKISFEIARKYDVNNINIDLIYGIPEEDLKSSIDSLNDIIRFQAEHISAYSLILEENTTYMNLLNEGKLSLKDEDLEFEEQEQIYNMLRYSGYMRYEISNFSKLGYQCKHNLKYWNLEEYIGIGSSSHSYFNGERFNNVISVYEYIKNIMEGNSSVENYHKNLLKQDIEEFIILGLRKIEGISLIDFESKFKKNFFGVYEREFHRWNDRGLIFQDDNRIKLTKKGFDLSNMVLKDFLI